MTRQHSRSGALLADVAALAAIIWVIAATLHEGLGHGVACAATGGDPLVWSTFHFDCARRSMSLAEWRIVSAAGTAVNLGLMALAYLWWRRTNSAGIRLATWIAVVVNGLTSFGYLIFSATFGIGDWNSTGVMIGVANTCPSRVALAAVGVAGYYLVIRSGAAMLSQMPEVAPAPAEARRLASTVWLTTGAVSLLAGLAAGSDWRSTLGASIGVALGGNAGLLSVDRFLKPFNRTGASIPRGGAFLWSVAAASVIAFVGVLGPGLRL